MVRACMRWESKRQLLLFTVFVSNLALQPGISPARDSCVSWQSSARKKQQLASFSIFRVQTHAAATRLVQ